MNKNFFEELLNKKKITRYKLCKITGISSGGLTDLLNKKVKNPRIDYIWGDSSKKWKVKESYFIKETNGNKWTDLSDHLPYVTVFSIEVPKIEIPKVETQKVEVPKEDIKEENIEN